MKQAKKLLTVILCAAMLIMSVPTQAFADGEDPSAPIETLAVDETTESLTETTVADETAEVSTEISITEDAGEVPAEALAVADTDVAKIGDTGYATFEEALAAAVAGDTIELIADVTLAASITISKDITL